mgnify:CR=1 FL=1
MDINNLTGKILRAEGVSPGVKTREVSSGSNAATANAVGAADESVTLTQAARSIGAARDNAGSVPFDEHRVAALKTAIEDGSYQIDYHQVASKMVGLERQLS